MFADKRAFSEENAMKKIDPSEGTNKIRGASIGKPATSSSFFNKLVSNVPKKN